jgi:hypothetical protein
VSEAFVTLRFSRCAPPTWAEKWRDKSFIDYSLLICRMTHSPFSHVDLVTDDGYLLGASDNINAPVITGNPRGVAIRPVDYQRFAVRRDAKLKTSPIRKARFIDFCMAQLGQSFDSGALSPKVFLSPHFEWREWRTPGKWFCAELMARATEEAPLLDWAIPGIKNRVTPADLILLLAPLYNFHMARKPITGLKLEPWEQ